MTTRRNAIIGGIMMAAAAAPSVGAAKKKRKGGKLRRSRVRRALVNFYASADEIVERRCNNGECVEQTWSDVHAYVDTLMRQIGGK